MADILIRGMKMPTCCKDCRLFFDERTSFGPFSPPEYLVSCRLGATLLQPWPMRYERRADDCPLLALPEDHGRLISQEELLEKAQKTNCFRGDYALLLNDVADECATIVPAEKEGS